MLPRVTALKPERQGRVLVELDGAPWRVLPGEAVARAGLAEGCELDRPLARRLRAELRRAEALAAAGRALRNRDLAEARLVERLERHGVAAPERAEALAILRRVGYVDDERLARSRARALAERGYGDAAILADLERRGLADDVAADGLASLEPEPERARDVAASLGGGLRAARGLARRGFSEDSIEAALGPVVAEEP